MTSRETKTQREIRERQEKTLYFRTYNGVFSLVFGQGVPRFHFKLGAPQLWSAGRGEGD